MVRAGGTEPTLNEGDKGIVSSGAGGKDEAEDGDDFLDGWPRGM